MYYDTTVDGVLDLCNNDYCNNAVTKQAGYVISVMLVVFAFIVN